MAKGTRAKHDRSSYSIMRHYAIERLTCFAAVSTLIDDDNNVASDENVCHTGGDADAGVGDRVDACGRGSAILANIEILRW